MRRGTQDTRTRLLAAAADRLWQRGYAAAGVDDLCRAAGAQKGSFYHFFGSKSDLVVAAIEFRWTRLREEVFEPIASTGRPGLDRIRRLVEHVENVQRGFRAEDQPALGSAFGSLGQEMAHQDARIRLAVQAVFDRQCGYLQAWLDEAFAARQIPSGDNVLRARQVLALLEGAQLLAKVAADPDVFADASAAWLTLLAPTRTVPRQADIPELL